MSNSTLAVDGTFAASDSASTWSTYQNPLIIVFCSLLTHPISRPIGNILFSGLSVKPSLSAGLLLLLSEFNPFTSLAEAFYLWYLILIQHLRTRQTPSNSTSTSTSIPSASRLPELASAALILRHASASRDDWLSLHTLISSDPDQPAEIHRIHEVASLLQSAGLPKLHYFDHAGALLCLIGVPGLFILCPDMYVLKSLAMARLVGTLSIYVLMYVSHSKFFNTSDKEYLLASIRSMHQTRQGLPKAVGAIWLLPHVVAWAALIPQPGIVFPAFFSLFSLFSAEEHFSLGLRIYYGFLLLITTLPPYIIGTCLVAYLIWPLTTEEPEIVHDKAQHPVVSRLETFYQMGVRFAEHLLAPRGGEEGFGKEVREQLQATFCGPIGLLVLGTALEMLGTVFSAWVKVGVCALCTFLMGYSGIMAAQAIALQARWFGFAQEGGVNRGADHEVSGARAMMMFTTAFVDLILFVAIFTYPNVPFTT